MGTKPELAARAAANAHELVVSIDALIEAAGVHAVELYLLTDIRKHALRVATRLEALKNDLVDAPPAE